LDEPAALYWELIPGDGEVMGVICPDCLTLREQRAIRAEKARPPTVEARAALYRDESSGQVVRRDERPTDAAVGRNPEETSAKSRKRGRASASAFATILRGSGPR